MKVLVFGCLCILFCAASARAAELPVCSAAEMAEWRAAMNKIQSHPDQIIVSGPGIDRGAGVTCAFPRSTENASDSRPGSGGFDAMSDLGDHFGAGPAPESETGIDRSNEPCWINFPQRGDSGFGQPLQQGRDFDYCTGETPSTIDFPRPKPGREKGTVGPDHPTRHEQRPERTRDDDEAADWRRLLLDTLKDNGFQQLLNRRRAAEVPETGARPTGASQLTLEFSGNGSAGSSMPVWQPRQAPVNLLAPALPGSTRQPPATPLAGAPRHDSGCHMSPMAAC